MSWQHIRNWWEARDWQEPRLPTRDEIEVERFRITSVRMHETWQLLAALQQHAPDVFRAYAWYDAKSHNWTPPATIERTMHAPAGTFDDIANRSGKDTWIVFVDSLVRARLPDVDLRRVSYEIDEPPGLNRPLQKKLYAKVGDNERVFLKSFRYFAELELDDAIFAKIMLLAG